MIVHPGMLVQAAEEAGMAVPKNPDLFEEEKDKFPHFFCFCVLQLDRAVTYHGEHWDNAKIIQAIPKKKLLKMTLEDFLAEGLHYAQ